MWIQLELFFSRDPHSFLRLEVSDQLHLLIFLPFQLSILWNWSIFLLLLTIIPSLLINFISQLKHQLIFSLINSFYFLNSKYFQLRFITTLEQLLIMNAFLSKQFYLFLIFTNQLTAILYKYGLPIFLFLLLHLHTILHLS